MRASFVLLFRQGDRKLTEAEQKRRSEEVRAWMMQQFGEGRFPDPRLLGDESYRSDDHASGANEGGKILAIVFIDARDFSEAAKIARTHPGLHYGVNIEVRPWSRPVPQPVP